MASLSPQNDIVPSSTFYSEPFSTTVGKYADAFARLRVSAPYTLFSSHYQNGSSEDIKWTTGGTGSASLTATESAYYINCYAGQRYFRQSKMYVPYQPGKSSLAFISCVLINSNVSQIARVGLFDNYDDKSVSGSDARDKGGDGHFFMYSGGTLYVTQRKTAALTPFQTDTSVAQTSWNLDTLDGSGGASNPSNVNLSATKSNIYVIEREWLGVGRVRMGIVYNGAIIWCHRFINENTVTTTYMKRASLPVRYEVDNTSGTSLATMVQICCTVVSEGGFNPQVRSFTADNGITAITLSTTLTPMLSIRLKSTSIRGVVDPGQFTLTVVTNANVRYVVVMNGTLTGASFTSANTNSFVEYDVTASAISGGSNIASGYIASNTNKTSIAKVGNIQYLLSNAAGTSDIITICAQTLSGANTGLVSLQWYELE
jgi:hypothetical protein